MQNKAFFHPLVFNVKHQHRSPKSLMASSWFSTSCSPQELPYTRYRPFWTNLSHHAGFIPSFIISPLKLVVAPFKPHGNPRILRFPGPPRSTSPGFGWNLLMIWNSAAYGTCFWPGHNPWEEWMDFDTIHHPKKDPLRCLGPWSFMDICHIVTHNHWRSPSQAMKQSNEAEIDGPKDNFKRRTMHEMAARLKHSAHEQCQKPRYVYICICIYIYIYIHSCI